MTLIPSNMHKCTQATQITTLLHQICIQALQTLISTFITSKFALGHLQCSDLQISKHQPMPWTCTNTPPTQNTSKNLPSTKTSQDPLPNQLASKSLTPELACVGPITYWISTEVEFKLHKQIHNHKGIWTTLGVRWSLSSLTLPFIALFLFGPCNRYGISQFPLSHKPYGFIKTLFILIPLTFTILWLMLYLQRP